MRRNLSNSKNRRNLCFPGCVLAVCIIMVTGCKTVQPVEPLPPEEPVKPILPEEPVVPPTPPVTTPELEVPEWREVLEPDDILGIWENRQVDTYSEPMSSGDGAVEMITTETLVTTIRFTEESGFYGMGTVSTTILEMKLADENEFKQEEIEYLSAVWGENEISVSDDNKVILWTDTTEDNLEFDFVEEFAASAGMSVSEDNNRLMMGDDPETAQIYERVITD